MPLILSYFYKIQCAYRFAELFFSDRLAIESPRMCFEPTESCCSPFSDRLPQGCELICVGRNQCFEHFHLIEHCILDIVEVDVVYVVLSKLKMVCQFLCLSFFHF